MTLIDTQNICHLVEKKTFVYVLKKFMTLLQMKYKTFSPGMVTLKLYHFIKVIIIIAAFINLCKIIKLIKATNIVQFPT